MLKSPGPVAFNIGPLQVHWYGIIIALAFLTGLLVTLFIARNQNIDKTEQEKHILTDHIINLATYLLIGAVLGARIYYVLFNWHYYSQHLNETFMLWQGGLSIHGAIIGGFLTGFIYTKIYKLPLLEYADLFSYGMILGQAIGRWGNFFNSEAFGSPTNLPWKVYIPPEQRPPSFQDFNYFHPTFLYESIWNLLVFLFLYFILRKKFEGYHGAIFFSYLILYSIGRFIIEGIRIDSIYSVSGFPLAQMASIILIVIGLLGLYFVTVYKKRAGQ